MGSRILASPSAKLMAASNQGRKKKVLGEGSGMLGLLGFRDQGARFEGPFRRWQILLQLESAPSKLRKVSTWQPYSGSESSHESSHDKPGNCLQRGGHNRRAEWRRSLGPSIPLLLRLERQTTPVSKVLAKPKP